MAAVKLVPDTRGGCPLTERGRGPHRDHTGAAFQRAYGVGDHGGIRVSVLSGP